MEFDKLRGLRRNLRTEKRLGIGRKEMGRRIRIGDIGMGFEGKEMKGRKGYSMGYS